MTRIFVGDLETIVKEDYENQHETGVWASGITELYKDNTHIFNSLDSTLVYIKSLKSNIIIYYHNLKFDGYFWLDYLMRVLKFKPYSYTDSEHNYIWKEKRYLMRNREFCLLISDMGAWYSFTFKYAGYLIELRDSLKLIPFSVKQIAKGFNTSVQKGEIEYILDRKTGGFISDVEKDYLKCDLIIVKEALETMFSMGYTKLTIGSNCLDIFKKVFMKDTRSPLAAYEYREIFPDLTIINSPYSKVNADFYIRNSYKGGWCYCHKKGKYYNGTTMDVNSLYPSVMHSSSNNRYPIGLPHWFTGLQFESILHNNELIYFVHFKCSFNLKEGYLPFIQIKNSLHYKSTEMLTTSDYIMSDGTRVSEVDGEKVLAELTLTKMDFELFNEHYNIENLEIIDGCYFHTEIAMFDNYINYFMDMKINAKNKTERTIAKLFLNNLYGKFATSDISSFKYPYIDDNMIKFNIQIEHEKSSGYIPIGACVTSYARCFTIRAAQQNYNHFCYADTDSIHCDCESDKLKGIKVHDKNLLCWKNESCWDVAVFVRQKTYIEHNTHENGDKCKPYYNVKCAGMTARCKELFIASLNDTLNSDVLNSYELNCEWNDEPLYINGKKLTCNEIEFVRKKRTLDDFDIGFRVPGKLRVKRMTGGIVLIPTEYTMH